MELRVFGSRVLEDGDVSVGVFPQREEIVVSRLCLRWIARQHVGSAQLQVRERTDRIADHNPSMIENLLEFDRRLGA